MSMSLRVRLSAMMFLEFFIWGAWIPALANYMKTIKEFEGQDTTIYGLMGLASIFMPIIAGQITDRWVPTQHVLGISHLAGGAGLLLAAVTRNYGLFFLGMLIWSLTYAPTISLTNSLAFSHIKDPEKDFGPIRVWGSIGWILAGLALTQWRKIESFAIGGNDCLYLSGAAAVLMGLFCFGLPNTPPAKKGVSPLAFAKAFSLLKNPRIAIFLAVSFVGGMILQFYFTKGGPFLLDMKAKNEDIPMILTIGQIYEILVMLALPALLKFHGPRIMLILGMLAFAVRNAIFAWGGSYEATIASIPFHGVSFVFFFVVSFIFIDMVAPKDIKGSAQGLLTLVVFGFGVWLGNYFVKFVETLCTPTGGALDWRTFHYLPTILSILCAVVFMFTFPKGSMKDAAEAPAAEPAPTENRS